MPSIGKTNALFVATLPYPPGVRQCRKAAEAAARGGRRQIFVESSFTEFSLHDSATGTTDQ